MIQYGILSTASVAFRFVRAIQQTDHSKVFGVASRSLEKATAFAQKYSIDNAFGSYEELIQHPAIDCLYICTPNDMHYEYAKQALLAHKHVIIEKPMTTKVSEAEELFELARVNNLFIMEASKSLFLPITQTIKEKIQNKSLGELRQIDMTQSLDARLPKTHWMNQPVTGGILTTSGSYTFEYIDYLLDSDNITSSITTIEDERGVTQQANIAIVSNNILISSRMAMNVLTQNVALFYFQDGYLSVPDYWKARKATVHHKNKVEETHYPCDYEMIYEVDHIAECIKKGILTSPIASKERTLLSIRMIDNYYNIEY